jgi:Cft2 family RNA processing exonuclease
VNSGVRLSPAGLHLPALALWLDPHRARRGPDRAFVSHAHADHTAAHRETILTAPTARLMQARMGGHRTEHVLAFGESRDFTGPAGEFRITLLPAGHILGSAMARIEHRGGTLLFTGDFKLEAGPAAEACDPAAASGCDTLIMETTFGQPRYRFPPASEVMADVVVFCRRALDEGVIPVLLGYSLGKTQDVLARLAGAGLPLMLHPQALEMTRVYEEFNVRFPPYEPFDPSRASGRVLLCPPGPPLKTIRRSLPALRTALLTGWAVDAACRFRAGAHAAFPLSDHADFPGLIEFVRRVAPRRVLTVHGFAVEFAETLQVLGYDARPLVPEEQLLLGLQ